MGLTIVIAGENRLFAATELARINSTVITLEDFTKKYKENLKFFQLKAPSKKNVLEDLIKRELAIQEAKKINLDKDPEVKERMNTVLYHALLTKKLEKEFEAIHISDDEAKTFYSKNLEIRTSHIFVPLKPDANSNEAASALEKIKKIQDQYLNKEKMGFAEVAQRWSDGAAAPMGGDIDYQTKEKLDPAYYAAAVALASPGNVSGVVKSQFGYHIIKLTAVRSWDDVDKAHIKRIILDEKRGHIFERYIGELRKSAKVSVNAELIKE